MLGEAGTYVSALYEVQDRVAKIRDSFGVSLPGSIESLEKFHLHLDIDLIRWEPGKE